MNRTTLYITILLSTLIIAACSSEKAIKKGDQLAAINEYFDAAKQYKRAYSKIPSKERSKRGQIAWKMAECYRKSNNPQRAAGAQQKVHHVRLALMFLHQSRSTAMILSTRR